jgi:hypothetical protein
MDLMKCSHCKFVGFAYGGRCKQCGQLIPVQNSRNSNSSLIDRLPPGLRKPVMFLAVMAIFGGLITGIVVVRAAWNKYTDPTPAYLEAINRSGKFETPVTLRVNQKPIPIMSISSLGPVSKTTRTVLVTKTAKVLEALGFLTVRKTTSYSTTSLDDDFGAIEIERTAEHIDISLTEKGQEESANWPTVEERYPGAEETTMWWNVPIGSREITRIEATNETMLPRMVEVAIHWRWHPNKLGEGFDCSGSILGSLPKEPQDFARSLDWNTQREYTALARLSRVGDVWQVLAIDSPNERKGNDF